MRVEKKKQRRRQIDRQKDTCLVFGFLYRIASVEESASS